MRVHDAFNSILDLDGVGVVDVVLGPGEVTVTVEPRGPQRCRCGLEVDGRYDSSWRRWRHLDVVGGTLWIRMRLPRLACPACQRVRTLEVSWARTGSRYTRAFEGYVAWLAQRMDLSSLARLTRCGWDAVHRIVARVVSDHLVDTRFEGLRRIGVDEVSYKKGHKYLTVVVDHDRRRVVWIGEGKSAETLGSFYDALGPQRCAALEFVTMDGGTAYRLATTEHAPQAVICMDPFHVMKWAGEALDAAFGRSKIADLKVQLGDITGNRLRSWRIARSSIRSGRENLDTKSRKVLKLLRAQRRELYTDWELKEELRDLFSDIAPDCARAYLHEWLARARRKGSISMFTLANRIARHFDMIIAAVENKLSNARLEGTNTRIKAIQRRGYGMPNPKSLAAMIYLSCGGFDIDLPTPN